MQPAEFLGRLAELDLATVDRAVCLLWWHSRGDVTQSRTARQLCDEIEAAGYARPNVTTLREALARDQRTAAAQDGFKVRVNKRSDVEKLCAPILGARSVKPTDSIIPREQFDGRRSTWRELVAEINGCYDHGFYDGSLVLARRLVEALMIEAFKANGHEAAVKKSDGYMVMEELVGVVTSGQFIKLSKSAKPGLEPVRLAGNTAAHSPHHIARKQDVDSISNALRTIVSELLNLIDGV